jgi:hypothetical protein
VPGRAVAASAIIGSAAATPIAAIINFVIIALLLVCRRFGRAYVTERCF